MSRQVVRAAFVSSIPVLMGYLTMGIAAGILLASEVKVAGIPFWAFLTSMSSISGALQFMIADWGKNLTPLLQVGLLTVFLNIRYAMYGLSLIKRFRGIAKWQKLYLIWTLTDETYALEVENKVPPGANSVHYCLLVAFFDHLYWIAGVVGGAALGKVLTFNKTGIDFAMTALFLVILTDQCQVRGNRIPAAIGLGAATVSRLVFPTSQMLIPAMVIMILTLLGLRRKLSKNLPAATAEAKNV